MVTSLFHKKKAYQEGYIALEREAYLKYCRSKGWRPNNKQIENHIHLLTSKIKLSALPKTSKGGKRITKNSRPPLFPLRFLASKQIEALILQCEANGIPSTLSYLSYWMRSLWQIKNKHIQSIQRAVRGIMTEYGIHEKGKDQLLWLREIECLADIDELKRAVKKPDSGLVELVGLMQAAYSIGHCLDAGPTSKSANRFLMCETFEIYLPKADQNLGDSVARRACVMFSLWTCSLKHRAQNLWVSDSGKEMWVKLFGQNIIKINAAYRRRTGLMPLLRKLKLINKDEKFFSPLAFSDLPTE